MLVAALLPTGGTSRRMGRDKAGLTTGPDSGETLAERTGRLLVEVADPAWEIGPGRSGLPSRWEDPPGAGPLAAVAAGARGLIAAGWDGPILVVATDLPFLHVQTLRWLAGYPSPATVIPIAGGRAQPLCARYRTADLAMSIELVEAGHRAMLAFVERVDAVFVDPDADPAAAFTGRHGLGLEDVDTSADLARLGLFAGEDQRVEDR